MVIFMPYYRQHGQPFYSRSRPSASSTSSSNAQSPTTPATSAPMSGCRFASSILCRFTFSLFLLIIALFIFELSIDNESNRKQGSTVIAGVLLIVALISFLRTCQTLRRYYFIMHTRRRLIQRLRERQQAYDIALSSDSEENPRSLSASGNADLPSYKELFPSRLHVNPTVNDPPPSYDDFVKTLVSHPPTPLARPLSMLRSHTLSLPTSSLLSESNLAPRIWITDRTRRPLYIRGTVTYV